MALIMRYIDSMQRYMDSYGGKCVSESIYSLQSSMYFVRSVVVCNTSADSTGDSIRFKSIRLEFLWFYNRVPMILQLLQWNILIF